MMLGLVSWLEWLAKGSSFLSTILNKKRNQMFQYCTSKALLYKHTQVQSCCDLSTPQIITLVSVPRLTRAFCKETFYLLKKYYGYICQAKLLNFIPADKQHLCRKHFKKDKQIFFFCLFTNTSLLYRFCFFPLRDCSSLVTRGTKSGTCHSYCSTPLCATARVPERAWRWISLHGSAAVGYVGGHNF